MLRAYLCALFAGSLFLQPAVKLLPAPAPPVAASGTLAAADFEEAAAALRRHDCPRAQTLLQDKLADAPATPPATAVSATAQTAQLLRGLYAHACGDTALAESYLAQAASPGGVLEDWRLLLLADSAAAAGHMPAAQAALARLIEGYPASALRARAVARAAALAEQIGDLTRAAALVEIGRRETFDAPTATRLDLLALALARRGAAVAAQRDAAKRLLVASPMEAAQVQAAEVFRGRGGELDWTSFLSTDEILARSRRLLELGVVDGASTSLAAVPVARRDTRWFILQARALTEDRRGGEALRLLRSVAEPSDPRLLAELEWERAAAGLDAATARRGKRALSADARASYASEARRHLERVAASAAEPALALRALRQLFLELGSGGGTGTYGQALQTLQRIKQLDASDDSGTRFLFNRGWDDYSRRNFTGALESWSDLIALYPQSRAARGARYWTGRCFAALGQSARADAIYREIATTDTNDFYRRHALDRIGGAAPAGEPASPREAWPQEPRLERARMLSDLGLDDLALDEMDAVSDLRPALDQTADKVAREPIALRAANALRALVMARKGQRRESLPVLRAAFPDLATSRQATVPEQALRLYYPTDYLQPVQALAQSQGLPPGLVFAIIHQESGFDAGAISHAGARGLMQLMSSTGRELARRLGLPYASSKLTDPEFSVRLGTSYFKELLDMFDGKLELALASYNSGPGHIQRLWRNAGHGDVDSFVEGLRPEETKNYVKRILVISDSYRQLYPPPG